MTTKTDGGLIKRFVCDVCAHNCGHQPKIPADSGVRSWLCDRCGHHNIGSYMLCYVGDWLTLVPKEYCS